MPSICFVGASHMVAHKLGAETAARPELPLAFWGLPGREFSAIVAEPSGLRVDPEGLILPNATRPYWVPIDHVVNYDGFDAFVVVGTLQTHQIVNGLYTARQDPRFTTAYIDAALQQRIGTDHGMKIGKVIREATRKPVALLTAPLPAIPYGPHDAADMAAAHAETLARIDRIARQRGLVYVPQEPGTIVDHSSTDERFAHGSITLDNKAHQKEERHHMNAAYGAIQFRAVMRALLGEKAAADVLTPEHESA